jgi:vacuolar-type H+-ATPase subunit E/Vma4
MQDQVQQAFDDLNEKVANIESAEQAAETLLQSLNEQLQAALNSSSDPTEVVNAIRAVSDRLNTDASQLAAAVTANTPAAPASGGTDTGGGTDTSGGTGGSDTGGDATDPTA